jgi:predicted lactoylglutathione lyase
MNIFLNLPVADTARSRAFFLALGFAFDERFSDDTAICMKISDKAYAMLLTRARFAGFARLPVADETQATAHMIALQLPDRAAVDAMVATALAHGGGTVRDPEDHGWLYGHAFTDPDGHVWEPFFAEGQPE